MYGASGNDDKRACAEWNSVKRWSRWSSQTIFRPKSIVGWRNDEFWRRISKRAVFDFKGGGSRWLSKRDDRWKTSTACERVEQRRDYRRMYTLSRGESFVWKNEWLFVVGVFFKRQPVNGFKEWEQHERILGRWWQIELRSYQCVGDVLGFRKNVESCNSQVQSE